MLYDPHLDLFLKVAELGSFSKAAEASFITPSAVIKQINLLEEDVGVRLFERTHRGLTLTKAGESLKKDAEELMILKTGSMKHMDELREYLVRHHPQIRIVDFPLYNLEVFNQCENGGRLLVTIDRWRTVHPLLKTVRMGWKYEMPYGLLYARKPDKKVERFPSALQSVI